MMSVQPFPPTLVHAVKHASRVLPTAPATALRLEGFQQWSSSRHKDYYSQKQPQPGTL